MRLRCPFCRRRFKSERGLDFHIIKAHGRHRFMKYLMGKYAKVVALCEDQGYITKKDIILKLGVSPRKASNILVVLTRYGVLKMVRGGPSRFLYYLQGA